MKILPWRRSTIALFAMSAIFAPLPLSGQSAELTLGTAVDSALANHPSLSGAAARVDAARSGLDAAQAARLPGLVVSAGLTRFQEPMIVAPFHSLDLATPPEFDRTLVQGQVGVLYTVFDGGARGSRIRGAGAMAEAAEYGRVDTEMDIVEKTSEAYIAVLSARAVQSAAGRQVAALEAEMRRAELNFDAGTAAELEVLRAAAALQDARAGLVTVTARVALSERSLARLMGTDPARVVASSLEDVQATGGTPLSPVTHSPRIEAAGRMVNSAEARVSEQRSSRLPTVDAGAGLVDFGTAGGGHVMEWQAGFQVSWPVFTGGARSASVRMAEADLRAARSDLAATELAVTTSVDVAQTAVLEADARLEALELSVTQWQEVARIEALALDAGSGVQSDLLRAEAGLFQARAGHAQANYDAALARVRLARAQGNLDRAWIDEALEIRR